MNVNDDESVFGNRMLDLIQQVFSGKSFSVVLGVSVDKFWMLCWFRFASFFRWEICVRFHCVCLHYITPHSLGVGRREEREVEPHEGSGIWTRRPQQDRGGQADEQSSELCSDRQ